MPSASFMSFGFCRPGTAAARAASSAAASSAYSSLLSALPNCFVCTQNAYVICCFQESTRVRYLRNSGIDDTKRIVNNQSDDVAIILSNGYWFASAQFLLAVSSLQLRLLIPRCTSPIKLQTGREAHLDKEVPAMILEGCHVVHQLEHLVYYALHLSLCHVWKRS